MRSSRSWGGSSHRAHSAHFFPGMAWSLPLGACRKPRIRLSLGQHEASHVVLHHPGLPRILGWEMLGPHVPPGHLTLTTEVGFWASPGQIFGVHPQDLKPHPPPPTPHLPHIPSWMWTIRSPPASKPTTRARTPSCPGLQQPPVLPRVEPDCRADLETVLSAILRPHHSHEVPSLSET